MKNSAVLLKYCRKQIN